MKVRGGQHLFEDRVIEDFQRAVWAGDVPNAETLARVAELLTEYRRIRKPPRRPGPSEEKQLQTLVRRSSLLTRVFLNELRGMKRDDAINAAASSVRDHDALADWLQKGRFPSWQKAARAAADKLFFLETHPDYVEFCRSLPSDTLADDALRMYFERSPPK